MSVSKKLNKTELALLLFLLHMPYASRVDPNLNSLLDRKLIAYEVQGWMRDAQRRFNLTEESEDLITALSGWELKGDETAAIREAVRCFGPGMECLYHVAPWAWSSHTVRTNPSHSDETRSVHRDVPVDTANHEWFTWLFDGPVHALIMQQGPSRLEFSVPLIWHGTHAPKNTLPDTPFQLFEDLPTLPDPATGAPAAPPGVVIVAQDHLAATRAARETLPEIPYAIVVYGHRSGGRGRFGVLDIRPMRNPRYPVGRVLVPHTRLTPPEWPSMYDGGLDI